MNKKKVDNDVQDCNKYDLKRNHWYLQEIHWRNIHLEFVEKQSRDPLTSEGRPPSGKDPVDPTHGPGHRLILNCDPRDVIHLPAFTPSMPEH
ncbi:hypothetical protein scyTo_0006131, partial [Scyliorhinus torazame]|nr:hypothetical protein [Scyliorhinus torazame]